MEGFSSAEFLNIFSNILSFLYECSLTLSLLLPALGVVATGLLQWVFGLIFSELTFFEVYLKIDIVKGGYKSYK